MTFRSAATLLFCLLICACSRERPSDQPPSNFDPQSLGFAPRASLYAKTDADIAEFVKTHAKDRICGLELTIETCTAKGLSYLRRLKGLYAIQLSGGDMNPAERDGKFFFRPVLTDDQFQEIAKIQSLRAIHIWYGSLSDRQKALLKEKLPDCLVLENLNKL